MTFTCGCETKVPDAKTGGEPPICHAHGGRIARVQSRPPVIVGTATGPHVKTQAMDPATPTLREGGHGPLVLVPPKEQAKERGHG